MTERIDETSRALGALTSGVRVVPGDTEHPPYETLEALVDGRLDDVEREVAESHIEFCAQCAQDLEDLRGVRELLRPVAPALSTWWRIPAIAAAAATLLLAVWIAREPAPFAVEQARAVPAPSPAVQPAPPPVVADLLAPDERALVDRVTSAGRLAIPESIAALRGTRGTLLGTGSGTTLVPVAPLGTAVASSRPSFSWNPVKGAQAYSVAVYDDRFKQLARSPRVKDTTWDATIDLPRDRALTWQVTAHLGGSDLVGPAPPQPEARFQIIDEATAKSMAAVRERLASRPLELAIILANSGLLAEASEQLLRAEKDAATAVAARVMRANLK